MNRDATATRAAEHFVKFSFVKVRPEWRALAEQERQEGKHEFAAACASFAADHWLRAYSLVGSRGDADLMIRAVASRMDPIHELHVLLNQSGLMRHADIAYSFLAVTRESPYSDAPRPTGPRPGPDPPFLMVYPMVKKREWYRLPQSLRASIMRDHIRVGRSFATVETNTSYSFGIDDQEFVVAFGVEDPRDFLKVVEALRGTEASRYTERETPIFTCMTMPVERALAALDGVPLRSEPATERRAAA